MRIPAANAARQRVERLASAGIASGNLPYPSGESAGRDSPLVRLHRRRGTVESVTRISSHTVQVSLCDSSLSFPGCLFVGAVLDFSNRFWQFLLG